MIAKARVAGQFVDLALVGHRQMGFGQEAGRATCRFDILVAEDLFHERLAKSYDDFVSETKDMWTEVDDWDLLAIAKHPPLTDVIEAPALLEFVVRECICSQFLETFTNASNPRWVLNNIAAVSRADGVVTVACRAFEG